MNSSGPVALALLLALLVGFTRGTQAQVVSVKMMRSSNVKQDDLYRKEEVVTVTAAGGTIQSPRFPNAYPRNLQLSWKLLSPHNTRITLEFDSHFALEEPENEVCRYDFVEVEDISETSTIVWGRWCGHRVPPHLTSKTNTLKVTFKSDDYFVAKPGFKLHYSLLDDSPPTASKTNWEAVTLMEDGLSVLAPAVTDVPLTAAALDQTIAAFNTVEQLLRHLNPDSWRQDLDSLYRETAMYRPRAYHHNSRPNKIDLDRLYDDVKRYSCTPRNYSVNLREELRATNAVFFPRCLLVQRCGGNCACGTDSWNGCTCSPAKTSDKLHEVLKYAPEVGGYLRRQTARVRWALEEVHLTHHERCDCVCPSRPPR
ncbi:platelet-derived growth factor D [Coregonus clupeaformis]|uniref:platelet-derived growth factor D n=1 Tax=Coregonus clupeaformis TaxID=59861 RepID=UPI001BDF88A1|nr:platelet-derived growth factor D [Coregonus clupeaformis]